MKKILISISFFACICIYSCREKSTQSEIPVISLDYFEENDYKLSLIADDITYITLDNKFFCQLLYNYEFVDNLIVAAVKPNMTWMGSLSVRLEI